LAQSFIIADEMVTKHKAVAFFLSLVNCGKIRHSQFATIALANIARKESFRDAIRRGGGIPMLVGCIKSRDYHRRRFGCLALANIALSPSKDIKQAFETKGFMDRIMMMAYRKEVETQREVISLIRSVGPLSNSLLDGVWIDV